MTAHTDSGTRHEEGADGWWPIGPEAMIDSPRRISAGGREFTAFRPGPGEPVAVVAARCPHRLVNLAGGTVVGGQLQCPYHGWRYDSAGTCVAVPSAGPDVAVPPRAHLEVPHAYEVREGVLWVAPEALDGASTAGPQQPDLRGTDEIFTNLDPSLRSGWLPAALSAEVPGHGEAPLTVRLLGDSLNLGRGEQGLVMVEPAVTGVQEKFDVVWIALDPPRVELFDCADDSDATFAQGWLTPDRADSPVAVLAENFLDVAHFPFVHAGTFGAAEEPYVPAFDVEVTATGLTSVQEQWFDNPEDPGVLAGLRPVRQRRRASYVYQAPVALQLRLEELDAGAIKTILFFLQPEDLHSTRIYTKMLFHGIGGVAVPDESVVAAEVDFEVAVLGEDLALQKSMTVSGLPLRLRDELHVRSDRSGVALRRILRRWSGLAND